MDHLIYLLNALRRLWYVSVLPRLAPVLEFWRETMLPMAGQWALNRLCTLVHVGHEWSGKRGDDGMDHCLYEMCTASTYCSEALIQNDGYRGLLQLAPKDFTIGPKWLNALVDLIERIWPPKVPADTATIEGVPSPRAGQKSEGSGATAEPVYA